LTKRSRITAGALMQVNICTTNGACAAHRRLSLNWPASAAGRRSFTLAGFRFIQNLN
jgi:hypothetical protein